MTKFWSCIDCGHLVVAKGNPGHFHWTDGHVCHFKVDRDMEEKLRVHLKSKKGKEARPS